MAQQTDESFGYGSACALSVRRALSVDVRAVQCRAQQHLRARRVRGGDLFQMKPVSGNAGSDRRHNMRASACQGQFKPALCRDAIVSISRQKQLLARAGKYCVEPMLTDPRRCLSSCAVSPRYFALGRRNEAVEFLSLSELVLEEENQP